MSTVQWERYEYVNLKRGSKSLRKLMLVKKSTNPFEMFSYFIQILRTFPYHQFSASWQSDQLRSLLDNLPLNHCVTVNDYSESYRCFDKTEIQTEYFQKIEVSLHVTLLYRHAILEVDGIESSVDNPVIFKEEFFVISEDDKRDQYFTHYKPKSTSCKRRIFRYVETIPRNTTQHFKSIAEIRKIHCVRTTNNSELMVTDLSCYTCDQCVSANYELCRNFRFRGNSRPVKIVREQSTENHAVEENNIGDSLLDSISNGTIIAVLADDDDSDFYLMKTLGEPDILPSAFQEALML
ncbi:unnamed protein product [Mytilus edulis]|uniref:Uncharacterized protein n=1 Tax=Mytilus edulis TaxID=6550 RepID=A0A8S3SDT0_MYTED|nr:unnamed protein product [Mytilus edulis]